MFLQKNDGLQVHNLIKSLWKKIHGLLGDHQKLDLLARLLNTFSSNLVAADAINSALCNVFQRESYDYQLPRNSLDKPYNDNPWLIDISVESVFWAIVNYPAHKAPGVDTIPTYLLQCVAHIICIPLCNIFNSSIIEIIFPFVWKHSLVTPVPKCSSPSVNDIRPTSLLPVMSKIYV